MKIIELSIRRRVTVSMFTLAVLIFGYVAFKRLDVTLLPELNYPSLTVRTEYPGAAPVEVENLVTKPIEEALGVVKHVIQVHSISRSGQSDVILEFDWGTDMDLAVLDVREKLDALNLPLEVRKPLVLRFDPSLDPIFTLALYRSGEGRDSTQVLWTDLATDNNSFNHVSAMNQLKRLRVLAEETLKKELESLPGVAAVKVSGGLEEEIQIEVDQGKLEQFNLTIEQIVEQLRRENVNLAGGQLKQGSNQYLVRTLNQFKSIDEIRNLILKSETDSRIYLKDVARIIEGYKERKAVTRINGIEAVEIAIYKEGDANTVSVARSVKKQLANLKNVLPRDHKLQIVYDQSIFIENAVKEVINAALVGGILAFLVLYFFLRNFWNTFIICISIPISVIATFNLMYGGDITLNIMSLGGLALGIGMLVDNAVVVLESIFRHRQEGKSLQEAAKTGASEVGTAVTASTLTTIAVFFPLVFVKGIAGQLFRDQALTVTFSLLASLAVALTLIPMLASMDWKKRLLAQIDLTRSEKKEKPRRLSGKIFLVLLYRFPSLILQMVVGGVSRFSSLLHRLISPFLKTFEKFYDKIESRYPSLLIWSLNHKLVILTCAFLLFLGSLLLLPLLGVELIPQLAQGEFLVEVKLPPGTPLESTDQVLNRMQNLAQGETGIAYIYSAAGLGNRLDANPEEGGENWGELRVKMVSGSRRSDEEHLMNELRHKFSHLAGAEYKFTRPTLFTFKTPIEIEIAGYNLDKLKKWAQILVQKMAGNPRFTDLKSTIEGGSPEIQIYFNRERLATYGLDASTVAQTVVQKVKGELATRYSLHDRKIDVLVRAHGEDRQSIESIQRLLVNPPDRPPIPLSAVAQIKIDMGPGEIHRIGQERMALVRANLVGHDLGKAAVELQQIIANLHPSDDITIRLGGQNREMAISFKSLRLALLLAIFLVYLVMASQFESLLQPFVILFTIPLALIGVVLSLLVTGSSISIVVFIGLIMLAGIVVNNAIVLIDYINQLRNQGMAKVEAIVNAGQVRLRPILMTTLTTTIGMLPLALGLGEGAELRSPMAITVIGGLLVATLLTLVVIPVVYSLVDYKAVKK